MVSRLIYCFKDEPVRLKKIFLSTLVQLLLILLFKITAVWTALLIAILLLNIFTYYSERIIKNINSARLVSFFLWFLIFGFFTSSYMGLEFNNVLIMRLLKLKNYFMFLSGIEQINWLKANVIIMALLVLLNEANIFIRYFFELFSLAPKSSSNDNENEVDSAEYNAGRIIGMLERILIFSFMLAGQYAAIGFIIAAKGFTRFKELDDRKFAEYVLIGTFLSALTAIVITLLVGNTALY